MAFLLNSQAQGVSDKMNNLSKHRGAGHPEVWGPMQLHRLHWLKNIPAYESCATIARGVNVAKRTCKATGFCLAFLGRKKWRTCQEEPKKSTFSNVSYI